MDMRFFIGVDEAGRGALAGPVAVGAVLYPEDFDWRAAFALVTKRGEPRLRDSKQLSAQAREVLFEHIAAHGRLRHAWAFTDASAIDQIGIVNATHEAAAIAVAGLEVSPSKVEIVLDAGLRVPSKWRQQSFVRGDETIPAIALASVVAKVARDRFMSDLPATYAPYGFGEHKGYGTLAHRTAIRRNGVSDLHRRSFCGAFLS
jgi:ribonuclease HII